MRPSGSTARARWRGGLVALAALGLAACGDSGSVSRQAASVSGPSVTSDESLVLAKKKGSGDGNQGQGGGSGNQGPGGGNGGGRGDDGQHRGRPEAELRGPVAGKTGVCPAISFTVNGVGVRVNGVTEFESTSCAALADGQVVKVEGQPLGNGAVLAREVSLLTGAGAGATGPATGVQVSLVTGGAAVATRVTDARGQFEFEDVAPGVYDLRAAVSGSSGCPVTLSTPVRLVARQSEVEGRVARTGSPATCANLVLAELEVHQGNSE